MIRRKIAAAAWLFVVSACLCASADPFSGTWQLNLSKSKLPPPLPKSQTVRLEAATGGLRVHEEIVSDKGERTTITADAKFDGKDYPIKGSPFADTVAYQRLDSHTIKGTGKKAGAVVVQETAVVSTDGKTLTTTYSGKDAAGRPAAYVAVFDKIGADARK